MGFCLNLVSLIVLCLGAVLHIVSIAVPYYGNSEAKLNLGQAPIPLEFDTGVWSYCLLALGDEECAQYGEEITLKVGLKLKFEASDWLKACEAFSLIGLFVVAGAGVLSILAMLQRICADRVKVLPYFACVVSAIGGVIILIGVIIFAAKFSEEKSIAGSSSVDSKLTWAFFLDIAACVVIFVAAILHCVTGRQASSAAYEA